MPAIAAAEERALAEAALRLAGGRDVCERSEHARQAGTHVKAAEGAA